MQQLWFDDDLGLKSANLWCFYDFPLFSMFSFIFMNMRNLHPLPWDERHMSKLQFGTKLSSIW